MIRDLSVIIPVKNADEIPYLNSILLQLARQELKYRLHIFLMVLDDAKKIADSAYRLNEKIEYVPPIHVSDCTYVTEKNGIIGARNLGAKNADGEILVHLDSDDLFVMDDESTNIYALNDFIEPILDGRYVMTYTPLKYDIEQGQTEKDRKLIKYNNFLLRFELLPKIPFAVHREVFEGIGGLEEHNTMLKFCSKVLWFNPGGIKKLGIETLVSPRNILKRANDIHSNPLLQRRDISTKNS
jgi:glycosyltransferase involved in cell wall biosynthesis